MTTSTRRPVAPLRRLLADEAEFIDAAFHCILPEARDEGLRVSASAYVDAKLAAAPAGSGAVSDGGLHRYRDGIADVQASCERTRGRRFQALSLWQQLAVLAEIDHAEAAPSRPRRRLLDLLLNDAAEAYFEVVESSWMEAHAALRVAAA
jgi:hypothetical protein